MKRSVSRKRTYFFLGLVILILLVALGIFYTRSILISSCASLSAQAVSEAIPFEGNITDIIPCPAPEQESIPVDNSEQSGSGSSGGSSSKSKVESNLSEVGLSPDEQSIQINSSNTSSQSHFSRALIDDYIAANNLDVSCTIYNQTIGDGSSLVILEGYSTVYFLGFEIKIPVKSSLVVSQNKIILECIKRPWWAYIIR